MRLRSTRLAEVDSRLCGPSFLMVRSPMPPPAVVTMMCRPPSASMACCSTFSVPSKSVTSTSWNAAADGVGHLLALRLRPVQDRHARATLGQQLGGRLAEARRPADDDGLLPGDLHLAPFPKSARFVKQPSRRHFSVRLSGGADRYLGLHGRRAAPRAMAGIAAAAVRSASPSCWRLFVGPQADSRTAVGSSVIDLTPGPVKEWAIHDVRHRRQARAVGSRAGGHRRHRRGRRLDGARRVPIGSAAIVARRGRRLRGGAVPRRRHCRSTSSRPSSAPCAGSSCCGC